MGCDLQPQAAGEPIKSFKDAEEVSARIRGSKTDQYNSGEYRNHFKVDSTEKDRLCVLEALALYERWAGDRCRVCQAEDPFFAFEDGKLVTRYDVQRVVEQAALAAGADANDVGTHEGRNYKEGGRRTP